MEFQRGSGLFASFAFGHAEIRSSWFRMGKVGRIWWPGFAGRKQENRRGKRTFRCFGFLNSAFNFATPWQESQQDRAFPDFAEFTW